MKKLTLLTAAALMSVAGSAYSQNLLTNGDFEKCKGSYVTGFDWLPAAKQKFYTVDSTVKHTGKYSLKISNVIGTFLPFTTCSTPVAKITKPLMIRGWAKYEGLKRRSADGKNYGMPFVGLWGSNKAGRNSLTIGIDCFKEGDRDWFQFERIFTPEEIKKRSAHLVGDKALNAMAFRINIANQPGTIWFDSLEMFWVEPDAFTVKLPVKDVSENSMQIEISVSEAVKVGLIDIDIDGKNVIKDQAVKSGKTVVTVKLDGVADGKHKLTVKPAAGFAADVKSAEVEFSKQPDAFAE